MLQRKEIKRMLQLLLTLTIELAIVKTLEVFTKEV